ncbi:MAG: cysP [Verrucomicrobiales bacterium]|nr:cysP [Verrucomicrobiales bacterium]
MTIAILLFLAVAFLSWNNGANDNFKGVAALYGSGIATYRKALAWATLTTGAGSVAALFLAAELLHKFSGKGLVPDALTTSPVFLLAAALGAGATVLLATRLGFPISTTHAITGALVGAGMAASRDHVNFVRLWDGFAIPLLLSPLLAVASGAVLFVILRAARLAPNHRSTTLDRLHFVSSGAVGFARGLNDTPKIAALLMVVTAVDIRWGLVLVGVAMAVGGWMNAHRVAMTMSRKITGMNPGEGFAANLATAILVTSASIHGLPVSTTHVSVGALVGIGTVTGQAHWKAVGQIVLSWIVTLPCGAALAAAAYFLTSKMAA